MPGPSCNSSEKLISSIINGILTLNSPIEPQSVNGKRQLETSQPFPEIWVNNVRDDDDDDEDVEQLNAEELNEDVARPLVNVELSQQIAAWIHAVQAHGFAPHVLRKYLKEDITEEDDDTWWEEGVVRVFQPYYDIDKDDIDQVIEGKVNKEGEPLGKCCVRLKNGDELTGVFQKGLVLSGMASISGGNIEKHGLLSIRGYHKDGVLHGQGRACIAPNALWPHIKCAINLEGVFNDGFLEGPVRGTDIEGNLIFIGFYKKGLPFGSCWLAKEGQGWLYGVVNEKGRFTGDNIAYIYPDFYSAISGHFNDEILVEARASYVLSCEIDPESDILGLVFKSPEPDSHAYKFSPSNAHCIPCDWKLEDNYEQVTVICKKSHIEGAGDGLFARRSLPADTIVSYYNGLRIEPGEDYAPSSYNYQIYVDWANTDGSAFVDIPLQCIDIHNFRASLAHKANHSFTPNCKFVTVDHPRFGYIPALKTIKPIEKDHELFSHYKYDTAYAPNWYQEAWQRAHPEG